MQSASLKQIKIGPRLSVAAEGKIALTAEWTPDGRLKRALKASTVDLGLARRCAEWVEICELWRSPLDATVALGCQALIWRSVDVHGRYTWTLAGFEGGVVTRSFWSRGSLFGLIEALTGYSAFELLGELSHFDANQEVSHGY